MYFFMHFDPVSAILLFVTLSFADLSPNSRHSWSEEFIGQSVGSAEGRCRELLQGTPTSPHAALLIPLIPCEEILTLCVCVCFQDSCVRQASRCVRTAKLVALQLHFLNQGSDQRVINLRPAELLNAVTALPRCYQVCLGHSTCTRSTIPGLSQTLYCFRISASPENSWTSSLNLSTHEISSCFTVFFI